jgi:hypothetical protein
MGLDQYLSVKRYISQNLWDSAHRKAEPNPKYKELLVASGMEDYNGDDWCGATVEVVAVYWRKSNAIHQWFVNNCADGVDDCKPMPIYVEQLETLLATCKAVQKDHDTARELLPTGNGFFFGSSDYEDWYWEDLDRTVAELTALIEKLQLERLSTYELAYQASW